MSLSTNTLVILCAIASCIIYIIWYYARHIRLCKRLKIYAGPTPVPLIGSAHYFFGGTTDVLSKVEQLASTYPSPFCFWLGSHLFVPLWKANHLKIVLTSPKSMDKSDMLKFCYPWLGTGLFIASGAKWKLHRKLIMPTFNSKILEGFVDIFARQSLILTRAMEAEVDNDKFNVFPYISLCTFDIICETAMGVSMNTQTNKNSYYIKLIRLMEIIYTRIFNIFLHPDIVFNLTHLASEQRECIKYIHDVTDEIIRKKKKQQTFRATENKNHENQSEGHNGAGKKAFLDFLMELSHNGGGFTDKELRDEITTMVVGGNDTTATVNAFTMLMLANFPEIQDRVYAELFEIYGGSDPDTVPVNYEHLSRMAYLERVIKETMRLFPIGPILIRHVAEDLDIGGHTLPTGSTALIYIFKVHRSERYWEDPLKFDPDRFLPENVAKRESYCYLPFSGGPRNCVGLQYAMMAMKSLLATVLRKYRLKTDKTVAIEDIELKPDIILKPKHPIELRIERRIHAEQ